MGRKSRAAERREAILAAFERCIGRYGIDASLEQIADEAGVQRSLIRHYLGNRDELVDQTIARIAEAYPRRVADLLAPARERGAAGLLDVFFGEAVAATDWDNVITAVVSTPSDRYPRARASLARMMTAIVELVADTLGVVAPQATPEARYATAYSVLCLTQANESLRFLGLDPAHTAMARAGAERLLADLAASA